jgi:glycosyltransferase involved in cell wall biosynthesis
MKKYTVGLNMIVKNEAEVILRLLNSVYRYIDYWVIADTGSTDNTPTIIQTFFSEKKISGQLLRIDWVDYSHCRNIVLSAIENKVDYVFSIDADEELVTLPGFDLQDQLKGSPIHLYLNLRSPDLHLDFVRNSIWKTGLGLKWCGPVHECLTLYFSEVIILQNAYAFYRKEGDTWKQGKEKFLKQAAILAPYTEINLDPRWLYYTGYAFINAEDYENAFLWFDKRSKIKKGSKNEIYGSKYYLGLCSEKLNKPLETIIDYYNQAHIENPSMAEPIWAIARILRERNSWNSVYQFSKYGIKYNLCFPLPGVATSSALYQYKMLELHSIACLYTDRLAEGSIYYWQLRKQIDGKQINSNDLQQILNNERYFLPVKRQVPCLP